MVIPKTVRKGRTKDEEVFACAGGCLLLTLAIAASVFMYWVAFQVAQYFGINGWIGCGLLFLIMCVAGTLRRTGSR